jgi:hypothetical protein
LLAESYLDRSLAGQSHQALLAVPGVCVSA